MAYIDSYDFEEYPYYGEFYRSVTTPSAIPSEMTDSKEILYETKCDIQESSKTKSGTTGFVSTTYNVYFPFNIDEDLPIVKGCLFKGYMYGMEIKGEVDGIFPTQFGTCSVYIKAI